MIGIILCSHSNFAQGLKDAGEMIAGPQKLLSSVTFEGDEDLITLSNRILEIRSEFENDCIYLCDLVSGTPFNACSVCIVNTNDIILTGASIPMLIEILIKRNITDLSVEDISNYILGSSKDYVTKRVSADIVDNIKKGGN